MSRPLRIEYPGAVYHITARGNQRAPIFLDESDRTTFLSILDEAYQRYNWACYAYCLMDNHYHLVIEAVDGILSLGMALLNGKYTQRFNLRHNMVGHVFQGRFKAILVEKKSYLLELIRYVLMNPVRARMVDSPDQWKYSSYPAILGHASSPGFLARDWILGHFGSDYQQSLKAFKDFVEAGPSSDDLMEKVRSNTFLGDEAFIKKAMRFSRGRKRFKDIPKDERFADRPKLKSIFYEVMDKQDRREAIYCAHVKYGYTFIEISRHLRIHSSTVSRALQQYIKGKESRRKNRVCKNQHRGNV